MVSTLPNFSCSLGRSIVMRPWNSVENAQKRREYGAAKLAFGMEDNGEKYSRMSLWKTNLHVSEAFAPNQKQLTTYNGT